jgi:hypothetical protein
MGAGGWIDPLWVSTQPAWFPSEFYWVIGCSYTGLPTGRTPVRNLTGGRMVVNRQMFESTGEFRTGMGCVGDTPLRCEGTDLFIRARQACPHIEFIFDPAATISHRVPAERATWSSSRRDATIRIYPRPCSPSWLGQTLDWTLREPIL